ncbi:sensor domain-containing protein [Salimicrobium flavidum]|uniref:PAS domain S-box-containing protein/diguanylate cyclase (GGDEF) domain-containing protein n=1 Tax=Salimicrobium flavidum TaxID=570947 RepID=A0A1N7J1L7_9BACI|nr:PAS domain S-box protein [Salimicrobium flavidum]SIS43156.1 PAS domain S-box-containing protein/diguanylate cyclase (GGDEF) domain-containing protein [Salimicrobium flavidum]
MKNNTEERLSFLPYHTATNEKLLKTLMEQVSELLFIMEVNEDSFSYTYVNRAVELYHHVNREDLYGQPITALLSEPVAAEVEKKYKEVLYQKEENSYEDVLSMDGEYFYGNTILTPLPDENGTVTHIMGVTKNETKIVEQNEKIMDADASFRSLLRSTPDAVLVTTLDGKIAEVNEAFEDLYGYSINELSSNDFQFVPSTRKEETVHLFKEAEKGHTVSGFETVRLHKNGREIDVSITMAPMLNRRDEVLAVSFIVRDISERVEAAKRIRQSEEKFQVIADNSDDLITVFNEKAKVIYSSPSHLEWLGYHVEGWMADDVASYIHPEDRDLALHTFLRCRDYEESFQFRVRLLMESGLWRWFECRGHPVPSGKFKAHFVLISRDVTSEVDYVEKLKEYAYYDYLTELPNRRLFEDQVTEAMEDIDDEGGSIALFYLDGDGFKEVNDLYGHDIGDEFLQEIGTRLKRIIRGHDAVGRLGGDEFAIMARHLSSEEVARKVARRIQDKLELPYDISGRRIVTSFSVGVAFYPEQASSFSELLRKADVALYQSKSRGKGLVLFSE